MGFNKPNRWLYIDTLYNQVKTAVSGDICTHVYMYVLYKCISVLMRYMCCAYTYIYTHKLFMKYLTS